MAIRVWVLVLVSGSLVVCASGRAQAPPTAKMKAAAATAKGIPHWDNYWGARPKVKPDGVGRSGGGPLKGGPGAPGKPPPVSPGNGSSAPFAHTTPHKAPVSYGSSIPATPVRFSGTSTAPPWSVAPPPITWPVPSFYYPPIYVPAGPGYVPPNVYQPANIPSPNIPLAGLDTPSSRPTRTPVKKALLPPREPTIQQNFVPPLQGEELKNTIAQTDTGLDAGPVRLDNPLAANSTTLTAVQRHDVIMHALSHGPSSVKVIPAPHRDAAVPLDSWTLYLAFPAW